MNTWKREGNKTVEYDASGKKTGRVIDLGDVSNRGLFSFDRDGSSGKQGVGDGIRSNNFLRRGSVNDVQKLLDFFLNTGEMPEEGDFARLGFNNKGVLRNAIFDVKKILANQGIDYLEYENTRKSEIIEEKRKEIEETKKEESQLNPYARYLENQRQKNETAELGLLNSQTDAAIQNTEISSQQAMIQQAQLKDQLVEQIKTDRLSKMRAGLTPMQIAQEELQFMVGNMQGNNQQMQMVNQQRLAATQQKNMNPYQAFLNSQQNVTGGQGYGNVAAGFAATDAGDLYQQALRVANSRGRRTPNQEDMMSVSQPTWQLPQGK
jgi:hypothetical protein